MSATGRHWAATNCCGKGPADLRRALEEIARATDVSATTRRPASSVGRRLAEAERRYPAVSPSSFPQSSQVQRDVLARGIFTSTADLARKLRRYIAACARQAKPFRWKYCGFR